jgi:hypothetical protein
MQINRQIIHNVVEYIKQSGFEFDCHDVLEDTEGILDYYQIFNRFNQEEFKLLKNELLRLAEERQTQEILYLIENHPDPLLKAIQHSKPFSLYIEKIFRKAFIHSIKKQREVNQNE